MSSPPRVVYVAAVEALARRVVGALTGADDTFRLADDHSPLDMAGLAAVRILGADALAPFVVGGHRFGLDDAEVIIASLRVFPLAESEMGTQASGFDKSSFDTRCGGGKEGAIVVRALRDWATGQALSRLGLTVLPGLPGAYPQWSAADGSHGRGWLAWSGVLAQLSPLVFPGLDCPLHVQARQRRLDVARGTTRALLRGDHLTAARLARWLALGMGCPIDPPFAVEPVLRQLELVAEPDPQLLLEITMARSTLGWDR